MKIWELCEAEGGKKFGYDEYHAFVVRAVDEAAARQIAATESHDGAWLDQELTFCAEVSADGDAGIILAHFRAG